MAQDNDKKLVPGKKSIKENREIKENNVIFSLENSGYEAISIGGTIYTLHLSEEYTFPGIQVFELGEKKPTLDYYEVIRIMISQNSIVMYVLDDESVYREVRKPEYLTAKTIKFSN